MDFANIIAEIIAPDNKEETAAALAPTPDIHHGDICLPCFKLAKTMRKSPQAIAEELRARLDAAGHPLIARTAVEGGYLNVFFDRGYAVSAIMSEIKARGGVAKDHAPVGKTVCIDYSSVNIAKPFHIGHLPTTVIGGSLYRIYKYLGYKTVGINHLGDWGTQFGKLIAAYLRWGDDADI